MTLPALRSTLGFIILDLVGVGIIGDAVAKRMGCYTSLLMPVSAVICIAAGYAATRRAGAPLGAMGGWIARRRLRAAAATGA